jgi:hypothetical protein
MNAAIPHPGATGPPDAREQLRAHYGTCDICGQGKRLCRLGTAISERLRYEAEEAAEPQISADARYIARTVVKAMIWIWVVLPIVAWILFKPAS